MIATCLLYFQQRTRSKTLKAHCKSAFPIWIFIFPMRSSIRMTYDTHWYGPIRLAHSSPIEISLIQTLGAGVDQILTDPDRPSGVPMARLEDAGLATQMAQYVAHYVLRHHRQFADIESHSEWSSWDPSQYRGRVGILGRNPRGVLVHRPWLHWGTLPCPAGAIGTSRWSRSQYLLDLMA